MMTNGSASCSARHGMATTYFVPGSGTNCGALPCARVWLVIVGRENRESARDREYRGKQKT
jgi:hypothetical protein